jgi:HD-GYP domain-containing protein (c-di-GMP phosphodiesterase class II)
VTDEELRPDPPETPADPGAPVPGEPGLPVREPASSEAPVSDATQAAAEAAGAPAEAGEVAPEAGEPAEVGGPAEVTAVVFSARQVKRTRDVLARLSGVRRAMRFYPPGHPAVREAVASLYAAITMFFDEGVDLPFTFFENEVLLGEQFLAEESMLFDQLIRDLSAIDANSVTFVQGMDEAELERAVMVLAYDLASIEGMGGLEAAMAAATAPHVRVAPVRVLDRQDRVRPLGDREAAKHSYSTALDLLRELDRLIKSNRVASADKVRGVVRGMVDNVLTNRYALLELTGLKDYDEYTFFHSVNVAILSLALGSQVSTDRRFLNSLGVGALMHDIGKMTVDLDVLNKPGALTSDEWALVRLHPIRGAEVAALMPGLDRASIVVILEHHMRFDLDGYPDRTPKRPQHVTSRIVAVSDAYDAMTSRRSYSAARLQDEAMEVLAKNSGTAFDAGLVRLFIHMMGIYPPRSVVRLTGGEIAVVAKPSETDVLRPVVRVFADPAGALHDAVEVDLSADERNRTIEACLDPTSFNVDLDLYLQ